MPVSVWPWEDQCQTASLSTQAVQGDIARTQNKQVISFRKMKTNLGDTVADMAFYYCSCVGNFHVNLRERERMRQTHDLCTGTIAQWRKHWFLQ